jgi:hypothetical protein
MAAALGPERIGAGFQALRLDQTGTPDHRQAESPECVGVLNF